MKNMKIKKVFWTFEPEYLNKKTNCSIGSQIFAVCPFCQKKNSEFAQEKFIEQFGKDKFKILGNGKCEHFYSINLDEKVFIFKDCFEIKNLPDKIIKRKMISVDDFEFDFWDLYDDLSMLEEVSIFDEFSTRELSSKNIKNVNLICTSSRGHCCLSDKGKKLLEILKRIKAEYDC